MSGKYYDICLYVPGNKTLSELFTIFEGLDDMDVEVDHQSFDFQDNGLFFEAEYPKNIKLADLEEGFKKLDVEIDWDAIAERMIE